MENVAAETRGGEQPVLLCCNDANKTRDGGKGLNVSLAAYLLNANSNTYFGPGSQWDNAGWDTVFTDFPHLTRPIGEPQAPSFQRDGPFKFSRSFEYVDVTLDCHPAPECASRSAQATCEADMGGACQWIPVWTPPGSPTLGACIDPPRATFHWVHNNAQLVL